MEETKIRNANGQKFRKWFSRIPKVTVTILKQILRPYIKSPYIYFTLKIRSNLFLLN